MTVQAGETNKEFGFTLYRSIGSNHFAGDYDYCESNPGLGLEYNEGNKRAGVLRYRNSYCDPATFFYAGMNYFESRHLDLGFNAGLVHGYGERMTIPAAVLFTVSIKPMPDHVWVPSLELTGFPGSFVGFGLGWRF